MDLVEMYGKMGIPARMVVYILVGMAIYLIGVGVERLIFFSKNKKKSRALVIAMRDLLTQHGSQSLDQTSELIERYKEVPLGRVVGAATEAFQRRGKELDVLDLVVGINRAVERTIERQTHRLKRGFGGIATIATTAPFVGLFGTVLGIINAFIAIAAGSAAGSGGLGSVSEGIAEALIVTGFGLFVAIPAVALYNYFTSVVDKMVVDMDEVASEMVEAVVLRDKKV